LRHGPREYSLSRNYRKVKDGGCASFQGPLVGIEGETRRDDTAHTSHSCVVSILYAAGA
jgi:hypothetical protein